MKQHDLYIKPEEVADIAELESMPFFVDRLLKSAQELTFAVNSCDDEAMILALGDLTTKALIVASKLGFDEYRACIEYRLRREDNELRC